MNSSTAPPKNIVLIGFMGSGKSTVGRELQQRLGYPLVDMDQAIEQRAGKAISEVFAGEGEAAFRDMETALLRELSDPTAPRRIISTGGGIVVREGNRALLKDLGYVVWLDAPVRVILERTAKSRARPLLETEDPAERVRVLMEQRRPFYQESSHLKLDVAGLSSGEVVTGILECARYFFTTHP
ncbi:MAG: shikimate kinase [Gloeobacteraceae cyanobacterium ES-bin-144]|nr:shikimate kinase [Verrucomicrobiales bacterium]